MTITHAQMMYAKTASVSIRPLSVMIMMPVPAMPVLEAVVPTHLSLVMTATPVLLMDVTAKAVVPIHRPAIVVLQRLIAMTTIPVPLMRATREIAAIHQ